MLSLLKTAAGRFSDLVFPPDIYCICCGRPMEPGSRYSICGACLRKLHWADGRCCARCGRALAENRRGDLCGTCREEPCSFEKGFSCVEYGLMEKEMLHRFKYQDKAYYGRMLGRLMAERLREEDFRELLILPVPMHKSKERQRGYDQAAVLAGQVAEELGQPWRKDLLCRTRKTGAMNRLGRAERFENLKGAFSLKKEGEKHVKGRHILLVDDIFTTGSTAEACSRLLLSAGAERVWVLCFAAVPDWSDPETAQVCG